MTAARALVVLVSALLLGPLGARADDMDVTLARLSVIADQAGVPDPVPLVPGCPDQGMNRLPRTLCPEENAWRAIASQMGFALAPPVLSPARTTGYGGLYLGIESWLTGIDSGGHVDSVRPGTPRVAYWEQGTEGDSETDTARNRFPADTLLWTRFVIRKGFPLGFELGMSFAKLVNTSYWAYGLELKWALFEGFRYGIGILPDIAVRGMVNTMVGESEFNLTVPTFDIVVSKRITVAGTGTITPMIAWQIAWIFADSELVDLTPRTDAFEACQPDPSNTSTSCSTGAPGPMPGADYNNNTTFDELRAPRQRLALGVRGQYQALQLTASFTFDLIKPGEQSDEVPDDLPRQWTVAAGMGLAF